MVTTVSLVTALVRTLNDPAVPRVGIVMLGTVAAATFALDVVKRTITARRNAFERYHAVDCCSAAHAGVG